MHSEFVEVKYVQTQGGRQLSLFFFYVLATCPYFLMGLVGEGLVKNFELIRALKDGDVLAEWNLDLLNST